MSQSSSEIATRHAIIDKQLERAGWDTGKGNLVREFRLDSQVHRLQAQSTSYQVGNEFADYALLGRDQLPLAIIEAKRTSRDALAGKQQASDYADHLYHLYNIEPFIFLCNGEVIWFWDRKHYPPRQIAGFFTPDDLARMAFRRQHRQPLNQFGPVKSIVDRPYQHEAIRRITEALERGQRKFLLVMATGTGKTRTVVALIDLLIKTRWIQRVLFLADRRELVRQALGDFKEHLPNETRARIEGRTIDHAARIHIATYPSMMQAYRQLSPGYYDLIVADESHRTIYQHYRALFDYFDAMQLGLTATPTDYIDHNTFSLFDCPDGLPTFYYSFEDAVDEQYLVGYRVLDAKTTFQIEGIKADQLPQETQQQLEMQGIDLSEIDFEGSDLERRVTNTGTNDAMVKEFMETCRKDANGTLPAKTIIFAISHRHAVGLWESFNRLYPDLQRRGLVEVIDSHMERADKLLDDFKRKDMPRVALSVDMLDTGVDIPAVHNLVFAKPVFSKVKFWQMLGRGARLWTDPLTKEAKSDFLVIDHWSNFSYFSIHPQGAQRNQTEPLPVRLFRLRLDKLLLLREKGPTRPTTETRKQLQNMLERIPQDNVNIRPYLNDINQLLENSAWETLDTTKLAYLRGTIAPLVRFMSDIQFPVMTFEVRTEQLAIAFLQQQNNQVSILREQIVEDLESLPHGASVVQAQTDKLTFAMSDPFWEHLSYPRIIDVQKTFAPLMRYRQQQRREIIQLNLPDEISRRRWIVYGPSGEGAFAETYREQVEAYIRRLIEELPALEKLKQGLPLDDADIVALTDALNRPDLFITQETLRRVYDQPDADLLDFLRHILDLKSLPSREEQISAAFESFIAEHPRFTATQIMFLRTIRSAVVGQKLLTNADLERPPFSRVGRVSQLFSDEELRKILEFANRLAA